MLAAGAAALLAGCSDASSLLLRSLLRSLRESAGRDEPLGGGLSTARARVRSPARRTTPPFRRGRSRRRPSAPSPSAAPDANAGPAPRSAPPPPSPGGYNHWSAEGGTPVTVGEAETAAILANRYGVPTDVLLKVNGFSKLFASAARDRVWSFRSIARPPPRRGRSPRRIPRRRRAWRPNRLQGMSPRRPTPRKTTHRAPKASHKGRAVARGEAREAREARQVRRKGSRKRPRRASLLKRRPRPPTKRPRSPPSPTTKRTKSPSVKGQDPTSQDPTSQDQASQGGGQGR